MQTAGERLLVRIGEIGLVEEVFDVERKRVVLVLDPHAQIEHIETRHHPGKSLLNQRRGGRAQGVAEEVLSAHHAIEAAA